MNHKCEGSAFTHKGARWYRCLLDGSVHPYSFEPTCPRCQRPIDVTETEVDTVEVFEIVRLKDGYPAHLRMESP